MAILLLALVYTGYLVSFTAIRVSEASSNVEREWPFPGAKVYDPYGDAAAAGIPGPYYQGVGAWSVR